MASLLGKRLLIDDDVRAGIRFPEGILKKISEAKMITAERKYGGVFNFICRTVPVLLSNHVISLTDIGYGIRRRLMVIPFDHQFDEQASDPNLFDRIWETESPGVLNRVLIGMRRVLQRGIFRRPESVKRAEENWLRQANPLPAFIAQECEADREGFAWVTDLYERYVDWAEVTGITFRQQRRNFQQNFVHLGFQVGRGNRGDKVIGLRLKVLRS
jgi:P4 family phage/plasmid primase-like protien